MNDIDNCFPQPEVKRERGISMVWLIPLITALIGGWLVVKTISEKGPQIEVVFKTAEGIEAGKTKVKFKEIEIGTVKKVSFSADFSSVILTVAMDRGTEQFLGRGTQFWVVKPRLSLRGASGLSTLLSGAYIEIEPGQGDKQEHFTGLDKPPVVRADVTGTRLMLVTDSLGSIDTGSPIYYQGILAGEVLGWELGSDSKSIFIHAFIKTPYNQLVRGNSRFWNTSGINLSVDAQGVKLQTESLTSLLYGGIAFETPEGGEPGKADVQGLAFTLYSSYEAIKAASFTQKINCILFFEGSVRGLAKDAPVEFKGIKVGQVKEIRLEFDKAKGRFRIPVMVELEPERFLTDRNPPELMPDKALETLVQKGLRARLETGSLLTGQLFVALDMYPDAPGVAQNTHAGFLELPTLPGAIDQLLTSVSTVLAKVEKLDMEGISQAMVQTLKSAGKTMDGANRILGQPRADQMIKDFSEAVASLKQILNRLAAGTDPMARDLEQAMGAGRRVLEKTEGTLDLLNRILDPNSPLQYGATELSGELSETARSIRALVDLLERHPNALIFGKELPQKMEKTP